MRLLPIALLTLLPATALAAPAAPPLLSGPGGTVFVAGGHIADSDADLWTAYAGYARAAHHQKRPKVAVFCTARDSFATAQKAYGEDAKDAWSYRHVFEHYGLEPVFVPIAIDNYKTAAQDPKNVALLAGASAVWFGGGAQNLHARCLLNDDGSDSPLMKAVRRVYAEGGVVGGTSAGAAIMDRFTYGDGESYDYLAANRLKSRSLSEVTKADSPFGEGKVGGYTPGFNFLSAIDAGVDTHVDARGRYGRVLVAMRTLKYPFGLALAEDTALAVKGRVGMAYGHTHVFVADGRRATYQAEGPYTASGVRVSLVAPHAAYDFENGRITAGPTLKPSDGGLACPADVLKGAALPDEMRSLALNTTPSLCCTTHKGGTPAFAFTLGRTAETQAFGPADHVSVQGLSLTVAPCPMESH